MAVKEFPSQSPSGVTTRRNFLKAGSALAGTALVAPSALLSAPAIASGLDQITVQMNWLKLVQYAGHFVALERGFFRDEKLDVVYKAGGPGVDSIALVAAGQADIGDRDPMNVALARSKGMPVRAIGCVYQGSLSGMMSLKSKPIRSFQDMRGKTIAVGAQRRAVVMTLLKRAKVDPSTINFVPTGGDPAVLATGQVDAYMGLATNEGLSLQLRGIDVEVVSMADLGDVDASMTLFATEQTLATRRDVMTRWMRAVSKGWAAFAANPEEGARLTVQKYGQPGLDLVRETAEAKLYPKFILPKGTGSKALWLDRKVFDDAIELAREGGANIRFTADEIVDQSLLKSIYA
ncbi:MAG: ABC transporter substrate-binding protein [Moraxellaceae bacterium]|nr:ABC transporter substrate-binding protein [Moraxellaceae bacterium]